MGARAASFGPSANDSPLAGLSLVGSSLECTWAIYTSSSTFRFSACSSSEKFKSWSGTHGKKGALRTSWNGLCTGAGSSTLYPSTLWPRWCWRITERRERTTRCCTSYSSMTASQSWLLWCPPLLFGFLCRSREAASTIKSTSLGLPWCSAFISASLSLAPSKSCKSVSSGSSSSLCWLEPTMLLLTLPAWPSAGLRSSS